MPDVSVLIPCYGNPLQEVWLSPNDSLEAITVQASPASSATLAQLAGDKARGDYGLDQPAVRLFGRFRIDGTYVYVMIVWLKPGKRPKGLRRLTLDEALKDRRFGLVVDRIQSYLLASSR